MTKVKICGITSFEDALSALGCGADMLGFNFYERSSRYIEPQCARDIVSRLPDEVVSVGVFVKAVPEEVAACADLAGLKAVQLHGDEDEEFIERLRQLTAAMVIKALRVDREFRTQSAAGLPVDAILLDSYSPHEFGGTGKAFDWAAAEAVREIVPLLYLAGGLTPENVAEAVRTVRPYAVDVASGVESSPGKKDVGLMQAFIRNAKNV